MTSQRMDLLLHAGVAVFLWLGVNKRADPRLFLGRLRHACKCVPGRRIWLPASARPFPLTRQLALQLTRQLAQQRNQGAEPLTIQVQLTPRILRPSTPGCAMTAWR